MLDPSHYDRMSIAQAIDRYRLDERFPVLLFGLSTTYSMFQFYVLPRLQRNSS